MEGATWAVGAIWSIIPPIIAIVLALLTKEVYMSLFVGILSGALFFTNFNVLGALETSFSVMSDKVGGNTNIIIFLVLLGMIVALLSSSGASASYGRWASRSIKSKRGALGATAGLGVLIFVDDYFNCLTVGTVMRPLTDRLKISRAKLAYIIDATAAPVCIIAPISSWAAAVGSSMPEGSSIDGFSLFVNTIPFNFYAILTLIMIVFLITLNFDFGKMKKAEKAQTVEIKEEDEAKDRKGTVLDLIIPIVGLIVLCICGMLYTGGILDDWNIARAFADCNSSLGLVYGSFFTIILIALMYLPRKIISFREFAEGLVKGFKAMTPAILILTFAWTLSGICGENFLNAGGFVSGLVSGSAFAQFLFPALFFLIALGLAFATGTSWGTFGILIPIIVTVFGSMDTLMVLTVAAVLAGAVCGDHISPISDTTILSSAGANCNHIEHVSTQIPYALIVALCCFIAYLVAGFLSNGFIGLIVGIVLLVAILVSIYFREKSKKQA